MADLAGGRYIRGIAPVLALLVCGAVSGGCYYTVTEEPPPPSARLSGGAPPPSVYAIRPGDQLGIKFYQNKDLDEEVVVRSDGKISLQLIGDVQAAGLEPGGLARSIQTAYRSELSNPRVAVLVRKFGGRVYVGGEVGKPGAVPLTSSLTLIQAIQQAGGFLPTAHLSQVVLIRRDPNGHPVGYAIDTRPIIGGWEPDKDVPLQPSDIAFVPRSKVADVNLFVRQYIRDNLPIEPGIGFIP
jgi:protein involved in polysaccharide export with SLBB domain